ncbi:MAG TPA: hypothetical protein VFU47_12955 [Armatimonadota bacterium]|nr:hypothetical protein [Armatimonadota bacterium]
MDFLGIVRGGSRQEPGGPLARLATIDPAYSSGNPKVTFDGEDTLSGRTYPKLRGYTPAPGDRVLMLRVGASYVIVGAL